MRYASGQANRPTNRHTYTPITIFRIPTGGDVNKNSSGDEIANVNFFYDDIAHVLQNTEKENLIRLTN